MKIFSTILLVIALFWQNNVTAQNSNLTYRVQMNTYVREVDTNMVQSQIFKPLDKSYSARVITVYKDSVYVLCFFDDKFTRTEFGLVNRKEKNILILSPDFNFATVRVTRATNQYLKNPTLVNAFKKSIAEINRGRVDEYLSYKINKDLVLDSVNTFDEPLLVRIAVVHKSDFDRIFQSSKGISFVSSVIVSPLKIRPSETLYLIEAQPSVGFTFGLSYRLPKSKNRFLVGVGLLASRVKINPQSIAVGANPLATTYFDPRYYHSYTIPLILGYEYKSFNMGLVGGWEQIMVTTPIPVPFESRFWMGINLGYRIF